MDVPVSINVRQELDSHTEFQLLASDFSLFSPDKKVSRRPQIEIKACIAEYEL